MNIQNLELILIYQGLELVLLDGNRSLGTCSVVSDELLIYMDMDYHDYSIRLCYGQNCHYHFAGTFCICLAPPLIAWNSM